MATRAIVWFRRDLRLDDNPAWDAAAITHREIVPLFVHDPQLMAVAGVYRRRQIAADLAALDERCRALGGRLLVVDGDAVDAVPAVAARLGATAVHANLDVSPLARRRDDVVAERLTAAGVAWQPHWGGLVHPPGAVRTHKGGLAQVFTPFWKTWRTIDHRLDDVHGAPGEVAQVRVLGVDDSAPLPAADGPPPFPAGEAGAHERLAAIDATVDAYPDTHDVPSVDGTTQLSAALRFGTVSPRRVLAVLGTHTAGREAVARQLAWRDWFAHLTWEHPHIATRALRPQYDAIAWNDDDADFRAWCEGRTGYPIVDAGMRQLAQTGWMHNRVRMITASFLVKDLLIDWRRGERWFRTLLADGEVSQNAGNWQWVAGTGPDAAPYFRIFNPTSQGKRFDPDGAYVRRWVPELAAVDVKHIHEPWLAGGLFGAPDYPAPIVDHAAARVRCLAAYAVARDAKRQR
jgi:deoxyribodipyrimidine photo-lyase